MEVYEMNAGTFQRGDRTVPISFRTKAVGDEILGTFMYSTDVVPTIMPGKGEISTAFHTMQIFVQESENSSSSNCGVCYFRVLGGTF
jgi:hypothetical protein